jgi:ABC-type amino acid transport substrate-binding protein
MRNGDSLRPSAGLLVLAVLPWLWLAGIASAQTPARPDPPPRLTANTHLRGGWYPWDPYQYLDYRHGVPVLTGFDVEIERALARIMNLDIELPQRAWEDHIAALAAGTADIAAGATATEARSRYAYFSKPYRTETDVLVLRRGTGGRYPFRTVADMLDTFARQKFRLGIVAGFVYADARINDFIADPANRDQILPVESDVQNLGTARQRGGGHRVTAGERPSDTLALDRLPHPPPVALSQFAISRFALAAPFCRFSCGQSAIRTDC